MMEQIYKYDVAFSFLEKDEKIAFGINQQIEGRITTFFYSGKQKEIVGKDGEEEFNKVFGQEARLVVVLYDTDWGKTPWTRIEETAIRNRAYSEGYDFVLFIVTKHGVQLSKWLPKNRLWFGLERYGIEGAAAVIESRIQELNGEVRELTAEDKAKQKAKEIEFEHTREKFLHSSEGFDSANKEVDKLFSGIKNIVSQIQTDNLKFSIKGDNRQLILFSSGYTLFVHWDLQYSNSLNYSALYVRLFEGSIPYKNSIPFEDPTELLEERYHFELLITGQYGWRESEFLSTEQLIEHCIDKLMNQIQTDKRRKREE